MKEWTWKETRERGALIGKPTYYEALTIGKSNSPLRKTERFRKENGSSTQTKGNEDMIHALEREVHFNSGSSLLAMPRRIHGWKEKIKQCF